MNNSKFSVQKAEKLMELSDFEIKKNDVYNMFEEDPEGVFGRYFFGEEGVLERRKVKKMGRE